MGSTAKGLITGFVCRLCSKMNRYVVLIYGEDGRRMRLAEKINSYLPVTVTRGDPLPKTVCPSCVESLEKHSRMIQFITDTENTFKSEKEELVKSSCQKKSVNSKEANNENDDSGSDSDNDENEVMSDEVKSQNIQF